MVLLKERKMQECATSGQTTVFSTFCFHGRHMPFIIESSNQYHTVLVPLLPLSCTLYPYFSLNYGISNNKSLHLEHTLPETCATTASFSSSLRDGVPVALKCHDYHLRQCCEERSCEKMMASNGWVAVKNWVMFSEHTHLSMKVILHTGSQRCGWYQCIYVVTDETISFRD